MTDTSKEAVQRLKGRLEAIAFDAANTDGWFDAAEDISYGRDTILALAAERDALQARVAELEAECWRMKEDRERAIGWRDSDQARADAADQRAEELEAKLAKAEALLVDAMVQLESGKIKTRRNRAYLIDQFLAELTGKTDE